MRTIKFRAWDESQKYMAYQGTPDLETIQSFFHHFGDKDLMQFTGFFDKNGKEIYEGDILSFDYGDFEEFKDWYKNPCFKVVYSLDYIICGKGINADLYLHGFRFKYTEVLGNIYENTDLWKN